MKRVMVRYKVKADRAAENERYITRAFEQFKREKPVGLRYASFKLDDSGVWQRSRCSYGQARVGRSARASLRVVIKESLLTIARVEAEMNRGRQW